MPVVSEVTMTPIASALDAMSAMAASPLILLLSLMRSSRNAAITTTGTDTASGATFIAIATDSAPNPTWERPSPIIEYRLSTRETPSRAAQRATRMPTTSARLIKE